MGETSVGVMACPGPSRARLCAVAVDVHGEPDGAPPDLADRLGEALVVGDLKRALAREAVATGDVAAIHEASGLLEDPPRGLGDLELAGVFVVHERCVEVNGDQADGDGVWEGSRGELRAYG
jgi:hypothetical protein